MLSKPPYINIYIYIYIVVTGTSLQKICDEYPWKHMWLLRLSIALQALCCLLPLDLEKQQGTCEHVYTKIWSDIFILQCWL